MSLRDLVKTGNIIRNTWTGNSKEGIPLYLGSGKSGACFDEYGLMHGTYKSNGDWDTINNVFMHADNSHRGAYGLDYWLPLLQLCFENEFHETPIEYLQQLQIFEGKLTTKMKFKYWNLEICSYFNPYKGDILSVEIKYDSKSEKMPNLILKPQLDINACYDQKISGKVEYLLSAETQNNILRIKAGTADSIVVLKTLSSVGDINTYVENNNLKICFHGAKGNHLILIGAAGFHRKDELLKEISEIIDPILHKAEAEMAWCKRWGTSYIKIPDATYQSLWYRSVYYILSSYGTEGSSPSAPMGWSGNSWEFHFPQDVSYIHPVLLRLGHYDIASSIVEFYKKHIEDMKKLTKRIYGVEGTYWHGNFLIKRITNYFRMAFQTIVLLNYIMQHTLQKWLLKLQGI